MVRSFAFPQHFRASFQMRSTTRANPIAAGPYMAFSRPLQADGTAWMAFFCVVMLDMALELSMRDPSYEDMASKFFEHFIMIVDAMNAADDGKGGCWVAPQCKPSLASDVVVAPQLWMCDPRGAIWCVTPGVRTYVGNRHSKSREFSGGVVSSSVQQIQKCVFWWEQAASGWVWTCFKTSCFCSGLWDEEDGFYYDMLRFPEGAQRMRVRSMVGLIPLYACLVLDSENTNALPGFKKRMQWFLNNRKDLKSRVKIFGGFELFILMKLWWSPLYFAQLILWNNFQRYYL